MTYDATKPADTDELRLSPGYIRTNWSALETALGASLKLGLGSQTIYIYADSISGETASLWSIVGFVGDALLAIKGGTTYTTGNASAGTWTQPSHTLTTSEIPAHTHTYEYANVGGIYGGTGLYINIHNPPNLGTTSSTGGGSAHNHGSSWRPLARVGILITKS